MTDLARTQKTLLRPVAKTSPQPWEKTLLGPGEKIVTAPVYKRYELLALLKEAKSRGEISNAYNWTEQNGQVSVIVHWLRPAPSKWKMRAKIGSAIGGVVTLAGFVTVLVIQTLASLAEVLWDARYLILGFVSLAVILVGVHALRRGQGCSCVIHGSRC